MDGTRSPDQQEALPSLEREIAQERARIIDGVLTEGLKSGNKMLEEGNVYLGSFHMGPNPTPHWADFSFEALPGDPPSRTLQVRINRALYLGPHSVLPVMTERPFDDFAIHQIHRPSSESIELATKRADASFLVIINDIEKYYKEAKTPIERWNMKIDQIKPEDLLCVVLPQEIHDEYLRTKGGNLSTKVPIKTVGYVEKQIGGDGEDRPKFKVPNYEEIVVPTSRELGRPIAISGIRLPINQEDLDFLKTGLEQLKWRRDN